jgi:hypothetical protein
MRKIALLSTLCLLIAVGSQSCSEERELNNTTYQNSLKADGDFWDTVKAFLKKKAEIVIEFGHNVPDPNNPGETLKCVFDGWCKIKGVVTFGANNGGVNVGGVLNQDGNLVLAFDKSNMTQDQIDYHFNNNQTNVVEARVIPASGIDNSDDDYPVAAGEYAVVYEDAEIIAVLIN